MTPYGAHGTHFPEPPTNPASQLVTQGCVLQVRLSIRDGHGSANAPGIEIGCMITLRVRVCSPLLQRAEQSDHGFHPETAQSRLHPVRSPMKLTQSKPDSMVQLGAQPSPATVLLSSQPSFVVRMPSPQMCSTGLKVTAVLFAAAAVACSSRSRGLDVLCGCGYVPFCTVVTEPLNPPGVTDWMISSSGRFCADIARCCC